MNFLELREKLKATTHAHLEKREFLHCSRILQPIPRGVICEFTGTAKTECALSVLIDHPKLVTFWVEKKLSLLPTALHQRGIELSQVLFAEAGEKLFQTLRKGLASKLFDCVIVSGAASLGEEVKILKALQLFARESGAAVFFLSQRPRHAWAIAFQISANRDRGGFKTELLKSKFSSAL